MSKQPPVPPKRALPSKEATLFKELLSLYETRQLKKGLKTADQILKKFPEHGETTCMRGLILTHMGKREEGLELVKKGMRLDLTSHICWHVFGLIQKGEKNYEEALKSYTQALRFDKDNLNILRDAAQLQTQLRLFDSLVETRYALVRLRPNLRQNWIALAIAHHLNGNLNEAKKILEHYQKMLKNIPDYDIEQSEILLYHVRVLEELEDFKGALSLLDAKAKERVIVDRTAIMEARARLLQQFEPDEAKSAWHALIEHNPDCYAYYRGYLSSHGLDLDKSSPESLDILRRFSSQISKARAPWRLALDVATGDDFKELVKPYLISSLEKGIPSLFADLKALYKDGNKRQTIAAIVEGLMQRQGSNTSLSDAEEPTTYLWTLYFLAQHYSYLGQHDHALTVLETALSHTPTLPELHLFKARVLKRCGDLLGAARCMNDARLLDGQDRFLNTRCAKYLLRAGMVDEAETILGLFTKKDASSPAVDLEDMQSLLYLSEAGGHYHRSGKLNLALKKYMAIQKIFDEFEDDQYDFHGYNLRKFTLNVYLDLLKWEAKLRSHPIYVASTIKAVQIFVTVHDDPSLADPILNAPRVSEKKAKKKAKKAQRTQEEAKRIAPHVSHEDRGLDAPLPKDDDPDGYKLLKSSDRLDRAAKLINPLLSLVPDNIEIWLAHYDVSIRRMKLLQAVKALQSAQLIDSSHPDLHFRGGVADLPHLVSSQQIPHDPTSCILSESMPLIFPDEVSLETYNTQYLQKHPNWAAAFLAVARVAVQLLQAPQEEVEGIIFGTLSEDVNLDISTAQHILAFLSSVSCPRLEEYRAACCLRFPLSTVFKSVEEQARHRQQVLVAGIYDSPETDGISDSVGVD